MNDKPLSSILRDEVYENLDFISKALEPYKASFLDELEALPEQVQLSTEQILSCYSNYWNQIGGVLYPLFQRSKFKSILSEIVDKLYMFKLNEPLVVNLVTNQTVSGSAFIVKKPDFILQQDEIANIAASATMKPIADLVNTQNEEVVPRILEVIDTLGGKKTHSFNINRLLFQVESLIKTNHYNRWKIRSYEVLEKMCNWISDYIKTGSPEAILNLTHLKVRTHSGLPIYEVKEVK